MMYNKVIPVIAQVTYLGVVFDTKLSWEKQVSKIVNKAYGRLNLLRAISSLSAKHNPTLLAQLYILQLHHSQHIWTLKHLHS